MLSRDHFRFAEFELDVPKRLLLRDGAPVSLNPKALDLLVTLVGSRGEILSKDTLLEKVWPDQIVEEGNLKVHVSALRKAFGQSGNDHRFIVTVPGRGYSFVADLDRESDGEVVHSNDEIIADHDEAIEDDAFDKRKPDSIASNRVYITQKRVVLAAFSILVLAAGLGYWLLTRNPASSTNAGAIESIAVMPFVNENGNADIEYLSDGMTETLINSLSQLPGLSVKARSSAFQYKGKAADPRQIGSDLDVQAVLLGRFIQRGDDLTLFLSLVDTRSEKNIWGKQYVRKLDNLLALQSEIARDVSDNLRSKLSGTERQRFAKNQTENIEAYNLYLQGRYYWNKFTGESIKTAIRYFEQAIEKDKNYAPAYARLSASYVVLGVNGHMPVIDARPKARAAAETAVALNDQLAEAHLALGANKMFFDWDFGGAEREFKSAMELDPGYAQPHELYAYVLRSQKRFDEAIAHAKKAHELDPLDLVIYSDVASTYRRAGQPGEAVAVNQKIIEMDPGFADVHYENGLAHAQLGNHETALEEIKRGLALSDNSTQIKAGLGIVHARAGRRSNAQKVINELIAESGQRYVSPLDIALIYSVMDEHEKAFEWIDKAFEERTPWLIELNVNPDWEPIRDDPRFQEILRKINL